MVTKGPRNNQTVSQARLFLVENRQCMQAVFKIALRAEKLSTKGKESLEELVDAFTLLVSATEFIEVSALFECVR